MIGSFLVAALLFAFIPAILFVVVYVAEMRHIRNTPAGRHLLGFTAIIAIILGEGLVRRAFRDHLSPEFHRVFLSVTIVIAGVFLWQRLYSLIKYQVRPRRKAARLNQRIKEPSDKKEGPR